MAKPSAVDATIAFWFLAAALFVLVVGTQETAAVDCNVGELTPCLVSLVSGIPPSPQCCGKLREQEPCLCGYIKNPAYGSYVNSPNAKKILASCAVPIPTC